MPDDKPTLVPKPKRRQRWERLGSFDPGLPHVGKVYLWRVNGSPNITARVWIQGGNVTWNTGKTTEKEAKPEAAREFWNVYQKSLSTRLHSVPFAECVEKYLAYADAELKDEISDGQRRNYHQKWGVLSKHFDGLKVHDVDTPFVRSLRDDRCNAIAKTTQTVVKPATVKKDIDFVFLVLRYAKEHLKVIDTLPERPAFRGKFAVIPNPSPFLTKEEFEVLESAAYQQAISTEGANPRTLKQRRELYAFITISVGACLRPDEGPRLKWDNCEATKLDNGEPCIHMVMESKRSRGKGENREKLQAWGLHVAVRGFNLLTRWTPDRKPDDYLFTENHAEGLKLLLKGTTPPLYISTHPLTRGFSRSSRSFRTTGMSLILKHSKNPDVNLISKVLRTSPEMVRAWYDQNPMSTTAATKAFTFEGENAAFFKEMASVPEEPKWITVDWYESDPDDDPPDYWQK